MNRPITTLFMLMSVDGKISFGSNDNLDFDKDIPSIPVVKSGLYQYYEAEKETDLWSFNTGRVQEKMGVNSAAMPQKTVVNFVVMDNSHLSENGVRYFIEKSNKFVLITTNSNHPAYKVTADNMIIINEGNLTNALVKLRQNGCQFLTIQSGGTINGMFLRQHLIDYIDIVVAPMLVGGKDTPSLIDGDTILSTSQLSDIGILKFVECKVLKGSYLKLKYKVLNSK